MARLGRPRQIPDLSDAPLDPAKVVRVGELQGSVALNILDPAFGDTYRYVVTFGSGEPDYETATTTLTINADEAVGWVVDQISPKQLLRAKGVRIEGDLSLPLRAIQLLLD